jgi:hypothetical protein
MKIAPNGQGPTFLEMWQGSQIHATQKVSRTQPKQLAAMGYISDTEEIINASWLNFHHDGATAFKLSERTPLPPALSAMNLPGGQTKVLNVHDIRQINCHPSKSEDDRAAESNSHTERWPILKGNVDNPNKTEDNC